jgi:rhodanese-related sulfurtransferase
MKPLILIFFLSVIFNACTMSYQEINSEELEEVINSQSNDEYVLLDVRTPQEYNQGHIPGAILVDIYDPEFREKVEKLDKDKTYYVICRSGNRSGKACTIMHGLGFNDLYNLEGGMLDWTGDVE